MLRDHVDGVHGDLDHQVPLPDQGLTAQARLRLQPPGLVQEILLVIFGLRQDFVHAVPNQQVPKGLTSLSAAECGGCAIDKAPRKRERPSDHTPVVAELRV